MPLGDGFLNEDLEKKSRFAGPENFLRLETDLDFSRCRLRGRASTVYLVSLLKALFKTNSRCISLKEMAENFSW